MGLFSPHAAGHRAHGSAPSCPRSHAGPARLGISHAAPLAPVLGLIFWLFQPCICLQEEAGAAAGTACCWLLTCDTSWADSASPACQLEPASRLKWGIPTCGGHTASTVPARAHPFSQIPWELPALFPLVHILVLRVIIAFSLGSLQS